MHNRCLAILKSYKAAPGTSTWHQILNCIFQIWTTSRFKRIKHGEDNFFIYILIMWTTLINARSKTVLLALHEKVKKNRVGLNWVDFVFCPGITKGAVVCHHIQWKKHEFNMPFLITLELENNWTYLAELPHPACSTVPKQQSFIVSRFLETFMEFK